MNIVIFNWRDLKHSWAGGGEIYVFELAKRWVKMGHKVTVLCGGDKERDLPEEDFYDGIKIVRRGGRYSLYFWTAWNYITKYRQWADFVVDVENGIPFFTPLFCFKPKVVFVYHVHGRQFFYELFFPISYVGYFIERYLFSILYSGVPIIAISKTTKNELVKIGFSARKIKIVYCGISLPRKNFSNKLKKFSNPTLLYLGRIKAYKRVDLLVKLFGEIRKSYPRAKLIIAGWGTEASYITDIVMKSPYRRKIVVVGPVSEAEKKSLLAKSWIFLNLSIGEGWGISVIEANLHSTPAIVFKVPGLSESVLHGKTGFLANNENEVIRYIHKLLKDVRLRGKMSKDAKLWAETFSWDKAANESMKIIKAEMK